MSKLISITAIAVAALLTAPLAVEVSQPAKSTSQSAVTEQIPAKRVIAVTFDFHARLLMAASERLDSSVTQACRGTGAAQRVATTKDVRRQDSDCPQ